MPAAVGEWIPLGGWLEPLPGQGVGLLQPAVVVGWSRLVVGWSPRVGE